MAVRRRITGKQAMRDVDVLCSRIGRRGRFVPDFDEYVLVTLFVPADETYSGIRQKLEQHLGIRTVRHHWGIDGPDGSDKIMDDEQRLDVYDIFEKGGVHALCLLRGEHEHHAPQAQRRDLHSGRRPFGPYRAHG